ncbi:fasciclin domain-containing protein [Aeromicrobium sp. CFBP 8757]|uniref:fasciclin domain-containing protein n=1 Tax=Aeromicrobium sp. CFBP 8757 TaxID=2775288 RepID=UPI00178207BF|nr:fasciclin domain-containing protein [Aeromicrobium sp. CFBP 8757]MBD8607886.1 fasciclin domain-containing protein [Aeromicrobium sp. CFBP 8757]
MKIRTLSTAVAAGLALTLISPAGPAGAASHKPRGTDSLASVLAADGAGYDRNWSDYDILDKAVRTVLAAKPGSPVAVLADGRTALTAFLPKDIAFRRLVLDLTGRKLSKEKSVFRVLAGAADVDTLEAVLLYHVVPGATITYRQAQKANGATLATALTDADLRVAVRRGAVHLRDNDPNDRDPRVIASSSDINKGNRQIAHGINRVLRPLDL